MSDIYERILDQTKKLGINGKELGELLGLKKSPLTDWKNKKSNPTLEQLTKMCEIFAISSDYLIFGHNNLTENEKELLQHFQKLPDREQIKFIGRIEDAAARYQEEKSSTSKIG